jgi:predicted nucleotidyltransferase
VTPYFVSVQKDIAEQISILHLFFESSQNIDKARELAKKLLKNDRHNLCLWNAYALIERKSGNLNEVWQNMCQLTHFSIATKICE